MQTHAYHGARAVKALHVVGFGGPIMQKCARSVQWGSAPGLPRTLTLATLAEHLAPPWRSHPLAQAVLEGIPGDLKVNIRPTSRSAHWASRRVFTRVLPMTTSPRPQPYLGCLPCGAPCLLRQCCFEPCVCNMSARLCRYSEWALSVGRLDWLWRRCVSAFSLRLSH